MEINIHTYVRTYIRTKLKREVKNNAISQFLNSSFVLKDTKQIANALIIFFFQFRCIGGREKISTSFDSKDFCVLQNTSFRFKTTHEKYDVIAEILQYTTGSGVLPVWSFKCCKISIGTHLQFPIIKYILSSVFPNVLACGSRKHMGLEFTESRFAQTRELQAVLCETN